MEDGGESTPPSVADGLYWPALANSKSSPTGPPRPPGPCASTKGDLSQATLTVAIPWGVLGLMTAAVLATLLPVV